jgi:hypothetical protein
MVCEARPASAWRVSWPCPRQKSTYGCFWIGWTGCAAPPVCAGRVAVLARPEKSLSVILNKVQLIGNLGADPDIRSFRIHLAQVDGESYVVPCGNLFSVKEAGQ